MKTSQTLYAAWLTCLILLSAACSKSDSQEDLNQVPVDSEVISIRVMGSETDSQIDDLIENDSVVGPNEGHMVFFDPGQNSLNKLMLFFPGTNSLPSWHEGIGTLGASMGYHVIVLRYNSTIPIYDLCVK